MLRSSRAKLHYAIADKYSGISSLLAHISWRSGHSNGLVTMGSSVVQIVRLTFFFSYLFINNLHYYIISRLILIMQIPVYTATVVVLDVAEWELR